MTPAGRARSLAPAACRAAGPVAVLLFFAAGALSLPRFGPAAERRAGAPVRAALIDASASVVRVRDDWSPWVRAELRRECRAAGEAGEELAVIVYAADVARVFGPGDPDEMRAWLDGRGREPFHPRPRGWRDSGSDLAAALAAARPLVSGADRPAGRLELFGDRGFTGEDPEPGLRSLAAAGVRVTWHDAPRPTRSDAALASCALPPAVEPGAPLVARVELVLAAASHPDAPAPPAPGPPSVVVEVDVEDAGGSRRLRFGEIATAGAGPGELRRASVALPLGPAAAGRTHVRARVSLAEGRDPVPENDTASATTSAAGGIVAGLVRRAADAARAEAFAAARPADAAALAGFQWIQLEPEELLHYAADLDLLVSFDVPLDAFPPGAIEAWVDGGGGWFHCGGWSLLQGGPTPVAERLPLLPDPGDAEPREVLLLVDGSGSMAGEPFAAVQAAALEMVRAARDGDEIRLRFFTTALGASHLVRARASGGGGDSVAAVTERLLGLRIPSGSTRILDSLEELATVRASSEARALVLLLTDGREPVEVLRSPERAAQIRDRLDAARTELAVIAVGESADVDFLELLVQDGEEILRAAALGDLEEIFQVRVNRERLRTGDALEVRWADPGRWADDVYGASRPALPPLRRFARSRLRPGASALWISDRGEPLLALQRSGAGRSAAWCTVAGGDWAPRWARAAGVFGPLWRWLAREPREGSPRARWDGGAVVVEGRAGPPAPISAALRGSRGVELARLTLVPRPTAGGVWAGVWGGRLPPGARARVEAAAGEPLALDLGPQVDPVALDAPRAAEFRLDGARRADRDPPPAAAARPGGGSGPHRLAPLAALAGLACLLAWGLGVGGLGSRAPGTRALRARVPRDRVLGRPSIGQGFRGAGR